MENTKALPGTTLPTSLKTNSRPLLDEKGCLYISLYSGELSQPVIVENMAKIKAAFPGLPVGFYALLTDRIIEKNFSNARLFDAVNHVIDNCIYPTPTIANFLSFDKKKRLYSYNEMIKKVEETGAETWKYFDKIRLQGVTYWTEKNTEI